MKDKSGSQINVRKKQALGRGLGALIPDIGAMDKTSSSYFQCDINLIRPNRYQPRHKFSESELEELSRSISEQGLIQPLLVRKDDTGYELIAGERRLRASKMAGLTKVPVVIKEISDRNLLEISIVENIQREDLNPLEEADAYNCLMTDFDLTQEEVADRVGKSRSAVANFLRLRHLSDEIKTGIIDGKLSMGHARAMLGLETAAHQRAVYKTVVSRGLSVRETEALIKKIRLEKKKPKVTAPKSDDAYLSDLADDLARHFGTKVQIIRRGKTGRVEIEFYGSDDLKRLIDLLKG